ncbi:MAG: exo-beta-N-acetylmuramidase NamZ domain-containing protein [Saprospiraceae bacterium]
MRRFILILTALFLWPVLLVPQTGEAPPVRVAAERTEVYRHLLQNKQVALVVNHSSRVGGRHLIDTIAAMGICVVRIFAPEHGFRGDAPDGEEIRDDLDLPTGAPIVSLYGEKKRPDENDLTGVDVVVFDIQDVGTRFYTYISTLFYLLEACSKYGVPVLVLDRPNPNGHYVDGPVLDTRLRSFVGVAPLPIVHGCTVGELARLFTGEYWTGSVRPDLTVIPCENYTHHTPYAPPLPPSPNLPNLRSILLYPSLCLFEGTVVSVGRGTDWPFQVAGHPAFAGPEAVEFTPRRVAASKYPPLEGQECRGYDFRNLSVDSLFRQARIDLTPLLDFYCEYPDKEQFFLKNRYFERLSGTRTLSQQIEQGNFESDIRATWEPDLRAFREIRQKYLLYPD